MSSEKQKSKTSVSSKKRKYEKEEKENLCSKRIKSNEDSSSRSSTTFSSIPNDDAKDLKNQDFKIGEEEGNTELCNNLPNYYPAVDGCRCVDEYQRLNRIQEGTYGVVYRAKDKRTKEIVALKLLKAEHEVECFPITTLREIKTLMKCQHENIVSLREVVTSRYLNKVFIVMEFVEHDLKTLVDMMHDKKQFFTIGEIKCLMKQLLCAVAHMHDNWVLHRDLKTSNLLLSHRGILKVADFGLAREYGSPVKQYTELVVTLWYRAPELLLGAKKYSTSIDIWSVACIFGELILMKPVFRGKSEIDQISKIFSLLGKPNKNTWRRFDELPICQVMNFSNPPQVLGLRSLFYEIGEIGLSLFEKLFTYDPQLRTSAEDALNHIYFNEPPLPIDPSMFPTWPANSEGGHRQAINNSAALSVNNKSSNAYSKNTRSPKGGGFCLKF